MLALHDVAEEFLEQHSGQSLVEAFVVDEEASATLEDLAEDCDVLELGHAADEGQLDLVDDVDVDEEDKVEVGLEGGDQYHGLALLLLELSDLLQVGVRYNDLIKDLLKNLMKYYKNSP